MEQAIRALEQVYQVSLINVGEGNETNVELAANSSVVLVLAAENRLNEANEICAALKSGKVKLVSEDEIEQLAPDCDPGAMPAVGSLFGLPTYADLHVGDSAEVSFNAGSHTIAVRVDRVAWEKALGVVYADLAAATWREPSWYRS